MVVSPELCRAARGLLGWSQQELASRAQVARKTIADFELSQVTPHPRTLRDVVAALEAARRRVSARRGQRLTGWHPHQVGCRGGRRKGAAAAAHTG